MKHLFGAFLIAFLIGGCASNKKKNINLEKISFNNEQNEKYYNKESYNIEKIDFSTNTNLDILQEEFLAQINQIRVNGVYCASPTLSLKLNPYLNKAAMSHAKDMALNKMVSHMGSGGPFDLAKKAPGIGSIFFDRALFFGYPAKTNDLIGEVVTITKHSLTKTKNIQTHFKRALNAFIQDPPHCKLLMNPRFKDVGIGFYKNDEGYYWAFSFGETTPNK